MKKILLGNTNIETSEIALGCMRIDSLDKVALDNLLKTAIELGITLFDHADIYGGGNCETNFGHWLSENKSLRNDIQIQSKCGIRQGYYDFSKEHIIESVDKILKRLQVETLDTFLLHRPDTLMEMDEVAEAIQTLKTAGKIKTFGVSNFNSMQIELLQSYLNEKIQMNQIQFGIKHADLVSSGIQTNTIFEGAVDRSGSLLEYSRLNKITLQTWSPFSYGFFDGIFIENEKFPELNKVLNRIAEKYNVNSSAIATAWILRHPAKMQVLIGTTNAERLKGISKASEVILTREEWYEIYRAAGNMLP